MSAVGLTMAMRAALDDLDSASVPMKRRLHDLGLIRFGEFNGMRVVEITPRGHAALAAPRMTQAEYEMLERIALGRSPFDVPRKRGGRRSMSGLSKVHSTLREHGLVDNSLARITPSGLKALNDVRAATGSELYKDNMP